MKQCSICKEEKPFHHFHKATKSKDGHHSQCTPCKKIKSDQRRQNDEYRQYDAVRRLLWILNNPEKYALSVNLRRTKEEKQVAPWTRDNKEELREIAAIYKQAKVLRDAYGFSFHVDHIVPLNSRFVSGFTCLANMEPLSASANSSKGNHWWPGMQEDLDYDQIVRDSEAALKKAQNESGPFLNLDNQYTPCDQIQIPLHHPHIYHQGQVELELRQH
jgi:hypothetical protein